MRRTASTIATGPEDDASFRALHDLTDVLSEHAEARVIGGHMVSLLAAAFPSPGLIDRRTGDADAGVSLELADGGSLHESLTRAGYRARNSNRYVKGDPPGERVIDLLVPAFGGRFTEEARGGRRFDAMPGLHLALSDGITIDAHLTLRDGTELECAVPVPTVESAVVLKAYAWSDRAAQTPKDTIDLSNLFHLLDAHGAAAVGGWRLDAGNASGARRDAARILTTLAARLRSRRAAPPSVDSRKLEVLIRRWVTT
jgi:predicted nucleotidyltransferase